MLMEHLSEHTQIKNIKVVRDNKGGVCAFVQCEVIRACQKFNAYTYFSGFRTLYRRPILYRHSIQSHPTFLWDVFCVMNLPEHSERSSYLIGATYPHVLQVSSLKNTPGSRPTQVVRLSSNTSTLCPATESTEVVPLDLPHAMRIWKHRDSRFFRSYTCGFFANEGIFQVS